MADWRTWYEMALASQRAVQLMEPDETLARPCASRIYYAAYQAVTAVLLYRGLEPPAGREAWSHDLTPEMLVEQWASLIPRRDKRADLARRLGELYALRVSADYVGTSVVDGAAVRKALRDGNFLVSTVGRILPQR